VIAWLIEKNVDGVIHFWVGMKEKCWGPLDRAIRFARREDAVACIPYQSHEIRVAEHAWVPMAGEVEAERQVVRRLTAERDLARGIVEAIVTEQPALIWRVSELTEKLR